MAILRPIPRADGISEKLNDEVLFSAHSIIMDSGNTLQEEWDAHIRTTKNIEDRLADIKDFVGTSVPIPYPRARVPYKYNTYQEPEWVGFHSEFMLMSGQLNGMDTGEYVVTFVLTSNKMVWADGESGPKTVYWYIDPTAMAEFPTQKKPYPTFDGNTKKPNWDNYDISAIDIIGGQKEHSQAGLHTIVLKPKPNYSWPDKTVVEREFDWYIERAEVDMPVQVGSIYFNNRSQEPEWSGYGGNRNYFEVSGQREGIEAGEYTIWFKPTSNTKWRDSGTDEMRSTTWNISSAALTTTVTGPDGKMNSIGFIFNGEPKTPTFIGYDPAFIEARDVSISPDNNALIESAELSHRDVGEYKTRFTPNKSSTWSNGTRTPLYVSWYIDPLDIDIPYLEYNNVRTGIKIPYNDGQAVGPDIKDLNLTWVNVTGAKGTTVKEYSTTFTLKEAGNTRWSDRTTLPITLTWKVVPREIEVPTLIEAAIQYNDGKTVHPVISDYNTNYIKVSGDSATNVGTGYEVTFELIDPENTVWVDGTTEPKKVPWYVIAFEVTPPLVTNRSIPYEYNTVREPTIAAYNPEHIAITNNTGKLVGTYNLTMSLLKPGTVWSDTKDVADKIIPWNIVAKQIPIPIISNYTGKVYNKEKQYVTITYTGGGPDGNDLILDSTYDQDTYEDTYVKISVLSGINANTYETKYELIDKDNTCWNDNSTEDIIKPWTIDKKIFVVPTVKGSYFFEEGKEHTCQFDNFFEEWMSVSGNKGTVVNDYDAIFTLKDKDNTKWANNTSDDQTVRWSIIEATLNTASLSLPTDKLTYTYSGNLVTISSTDIIGFDDNLFTIGGDTSGTKAKDYALKIYIKDQTTYKWSDINKPVNEPVDIIWTIQKKSLTVPTIKNATTAYFYSGSPITLNKDEHFTFDTAIDKNLIDISGNVETNAGDHTVTFSIGSEHKSSCYWGTNTSDTADKTAPWKINKSPVQSWSISTSSVDINSDINPSADVVVTRPGDGKVTAVSSNDKVLLTAVIDETGATSTVRLSDGGTSGNATATIKFEEGSNYLSSAESNVKTSGDCKPSFTVSAVVVSRKKLKDYTPAEIVDIVKKGLARSTWDIGDMVPIQFSNLKLYNNSYTKISGTFNAVIIGFDHNLESENSGTAHTMTLAIMYDQTGTTPIAFYDQGLGGVTASNSDSATSSGGTLYNIYNAMETPWKNVVLTTTKKDPLGKTVLANVLKVIPKTGSTTTSTRGEMTVLENGTTHKIDYGTVEVNLKEDKITFKEFNGDDSDLIIYSTDYSTTKNYKTFMLSPYEVYGTNLNSSKQVDLDIHRQFSKEWRTSGSVTNQKRYEYFNSNAFPTTVMPHTLAETDKNIHVVSRSDAIISGAMGPAYAYRICKALLTKSAYYYNSSKKKNILWEHNWIINSSDTLIYNNCTTSTLRSTNTAGNFAAGIIPCFNIGG